MTEQFVIKQKYVITYQTPYNECEWRFKEFDTHQEAVRMVNFYRDCGSPARHVN